MVLPTGGRKPGIPGQSRNELTDRILGLGGALEAATIGLPTIVTNNYTRHLSRYESLAAAIADLPNAGADGGEIAMDGEYTIATIGQLAIPSKVNLVGRGSGSTALIAPAGVTTPVIDIDGKSKVALHGFSILKAAGAAATSAGYAVRIRGAATDILLDDIFSDELMAGVYAAGSEGTTPGTIRRLSLRNVRVARSPGLWGMSFDDVDVVNVVDCHSYENWLDGYKFRKKSKNITILGGSGNNNGKIVEGTGAGNGDGIDAYAGGDTFSLIGFTANGNYGSGAQIKTGPLTRDDPANYGYVRNMNITDFDAAENTTAGLLINVNDPGELDVGEIQPVIPNVSIAGGTLRENTLYGLYINARNVVATGVKAVRNAGPGFVTGDRAMDVILNTPVAIANGYPTNNGAHGISISGTNITLNSPLVIGRDADDVALEADYDGTIYTNHAVTIATKAAGTITINDPKFRHCSQNKAYPSGAIAGKLIVHASGTGSPNTTGIFGSPGSSWVQTDASGKQTRWTKLAGAANDASGWSPQLHGAAPRTQSLNFGSIAAGASETLTIGFSVADGVAAGDMAIVTPPSTLNAGLIVDAWCTDNTVNIRVSNPTGSAIDPVSGTWTAATIKV